MEGISDSWFLPKVLERALDDLCLRLAAARVDDAVVEVLPTIRTADGPVAVSAAVKERLDSFVIAFFHYDGTAKPHREQARWWEPLMEVCPQLPGERQWVPVVPVREMEAWALADKAALLSVAGSDWAERKVSQADRLPDVQSLEDPKLTLSQIVGCGRGARRPGRKAEEYLPLLAERISLEQLRTVPSFQQWSDDTVKALRKMRFLP